MKQAAERYGVGSAPADDAGAFAATARHASPHVVVELRGDLDEYSIGDFHRALAGVEPASSGILVLDMSGVRYVDSHGLGALIGAQKRLRDEGRSLALAGCQEAVAMALALTRLEVLFPRYPSVGSVPYIAN